MDDSSKAILQEFCPKTLQDVRGHPELTGNEPLLGHIVWELVSHSFLLAFTPLLPSHIDLS
jgi:hypothetical protein